MPNIVPSPMRPVRGPDEPYDTPARLRATLFEPRHCGLTRRKRRGHLLLRERPCFAQLSERHRLAQSSGLCRHARSALWRETLGEFAERPMSCHGSTPLLSDHFTYSGKITQQANPAGERAIERYQVLRLAQAPCERPPGQIWDRLLERRRVAVLECRDERNLTRL
jgi:hypothetical protein